eukprot:4038367-Pleurochrysis_carterae.AAC.1
MQFDVDSDSSSGIAELFNMLSAFHKPLSADELAMHAASDSDGDAEYVSTSSQPAPSSTSHAPHFNCVPQPPTKSKR